MSKICLKRGFGWSRSYYSRESETLVSREVSSRKVGLARSLVRAKRDLTLVTR